MTEPGSGLRPSGRAPTSVGRHPDAARTAGLPQKIRRTRSAPRIGKAEPSSSQRITPKQSGAAAESRRRGIPCAVLRSCMIDSTLGLYGTGAATPAPGRRLGFLSSQGRKTASGIRCPAVSIRMDRRCITDRAARTPKRPSREVLHRPQEPVQGPWSEQRSGPRSIAPWWPGWSRGRRLEGLGRPEIPPSAPITHVRGGRTARRGCGRSTPPDTPVRNGILQGCQRCDRPAAPSQGSQNIKLKLAA